MGGFMNDKGISLIEIMISLAVISVASLAFSQSMINQSKNVAFLEARMSRTQLETELRHELISNSHCEANFNGKIIGATPLNTNIIGLDGNVKFNAANAALNKYDDLIIKSIQLRNVSTSGANSEGYVDLVVKTETPLKRALRDFSVRLYMRLGANSEVNSCANDGGQDAECLDLASSVEVFDGSRSLAVSAQAKVIEIPLISGSHSWQSGGTGPTGGNNHSCSWGRNSATDNKIVIHLGKTKTTSGHILQPGKTLQYIQSGSIQSGSIPSGSSGQPLGGGDGRFVYDGHEIASAEFGCDSNDDKSWTTRVPIKATLGAICPSGSVPGGTRVYVWK
jgi:prepilin-type N-terminal cleavage/methylation domain-containing protein